MNSNRQWVALLAEDEDDYIYWQHGFDSWASQLRLKWFATGEDFFACPELVQHQPTTLLLDGLMPRSEEPAWLKRILSHGGCQSLRIIMLSGEFSNGQREEYLALGATECMLKPKSQQELQWAVGRVSKA